MRKRFLRSISSKIRLGFFTLVGLILVNGIITIRTLNRSTQLDHKVSNVLTPSLREISEFELFITNSKEHCKKWVYELHKEDREIFLAKLKDTYPKLRQDLMELSDKWENKQEKEEFLLILDSTEVLLKTMTKVASTELSMDNLDLLYSTILVVENDIIPKTEKLLKEIDVLSMDLEHSIDEIDQIKLNSFQFLKRVIYGFVIFLIFVGVVISIGTERIIVNPITKLKTAIDILRRGEIPDLLINESRDEIGEIGKSLNRLIQAREHTTGFAEKIGREDFSAEYEMLSEKDILGLSLITMRDNLKASKEEIDKKQKALQHANEIVESRNKKITESIYYAQRIQNAILPTDEIIQKYFPKSFIYYEPRDVVSGDFPWMYVKDDDIYVAAVDCTGHGVPGAMLSFVGYFSLNEILWKHGALPPSIILDKLNRRINFTLRRKKEGEPVRDGMDIALCKINLKKKEVEYAGAYRPLYHLHKDGVKRVKGDKMPIGRVHHSNDLEYKNHVIKVEEGDGIFIFSDGLPDQFGGENPEVDQYLSGRVKRIIQENASMEMPKLKNKLQKDFHDFKGNTKQTDDVLLIGIKI